MTDSPSRRRSHQVWYYGLQGMQGNEIPSQSSALQEGLRGQSSDSVRLTDSICSTSSDWASQIDIEAVTNAFDHLSGEDGLLGLEQLSTLLQDVGLQAPSDIVLGLVEATASTDWALNLAET